MDCLDQILYVDPCFLCFGKRMSTWFHQKLMGPKARGPLPLYLFILGMEVLSTLLNKSVEGDYISGYRIKGKNRGEGTVSHDKSYALCR